MPNPFFSVIIPAYNLEQYIAVTIQSVLDQTFKDFEIIIVDDGSTDKTVSVIQSFHDPRIRLISQPNGGVSKARNTGIQIANGKYIAFLDGDDFWYPEHLMLAFEFFKYHPNILVYSNRYILNELKNIPIRPCPISISIRQLGIRGILFMHPSNVIMNSILISKLPPWENGMKYGEDLLYWIRCIRETHLIGLGGIVTAIYRQRESSAINSEHYQHTPLYKIISPLLDELESMYKSNWQFAVHFLILRELHPYRLDALNEETRHSLIKRIRQLLHPYLNRPAFDTYINAYSSKIKTEQTFNTMQNKTMLLCKWLDRLERKTRRLIHKFKSL